MSTDEMAGTERESARGALPPWLHPDDDEMPPAALQALYRQLPVDVTRVCERARKAMRDEFVRGLVAVRGALAPHGLFKEWCVAAGINYRTATTILQRHDPKARQKEQEQQEPAAGEEDQAGDTSPSNRPPAKKSQLVVTFATQEERNATVAGLRDVLDAHEVKRDDWACALALLLASYEVQHQQHEQEPAA
jgi:hypothetical protein